MSAGSSSPSVQSPVQVTTPLRDSGPNKSPHSEQTNPADFVSGTLRRVGWSIKLNDLTAHALALMAGVVGYLLAMALIDHWIVDLTTAHRWLSWTVLVTAIAFYLIWNLLPLFFRRINPLYSARVIEKGEPGLNNSLISFVLVRPGTQPLHAAIRQMIERRAAQRLASIEVDSATDRKWTVRTTLLLAATVVAFAFYIAISPKSPIQSVSRVLLPWANIARPSRVTISDVVPGDTEVFEGASLWVSAHIEPALDLDRVVLVYSSADSQVVDRRITMTRETATKKFSAEMPADAEGIHQDLTYHIEAADAKTPKYRVSKLNALSMVVQAIEYVYPSYTNMAPVTVEREGDIKALEGTQVTIRAQANRDIAEAYLEFDPNADDVDPLLGPASEADPTKSDPASRRLVMNTSGRQANVSFGLRFEPDGTTPQYGSYQLRFHGENGQENAQPILHTIEVVRDLSPEVEIVQPTRRTVEVPLDGRQIIEVRALDPDFALGQLALRAVNGGSVLFDEQLIEREETGQTMRRFEFVPRQHGLEVDDFVIYWAVAGDNRVDAVTAAPVPNIDRTVNYKLKITPPLQRDPGRNESGKEESDPDATDTETEAGEDSSDDGSGIGGSGGGEGEEASGGTSGQGDSGGQGEQGQGEQGQGGAGDSSGGNGDSEASGSSDAAGERGESHDTGSKGRDSSAADSSSESNDPSDESDSAGGHRSESGNSGSDHDPSDQAAGRGGTGDEASEQSVDQHDADEGQSSGGQSSEGEGQGDREAAAESAESADGDESRDSDEPLPSDGTQDGEAFDRILEHIRSKTGQTPDEHDPSDADCPNGECEDGESGGEQGGGEQGGARDSEPKSETGESGSPQGDETTSDSEQPESDIESDSPPGGVGKNSSSGSGNPSDQETGSSASEAQRQPSEKNRNDGSPKDASDDAEPPSAAGQDGDKPPRESDSQGGSGGDLSGGGDQGGGEGADQAGRDSDGSNTPSDNGSGAANEPGSGESGDQPGDDQSAQDPTGNSGQEAGDGTASRPSGESNQGQSDPSSNGSSAEGDPSAAGGGGDPQDAGGDPGDERPTEDEEPGDDVEPSGDDPNLEYARKATDLALDYLRDDRDKFDEDLLAELGDWSTEDMERFIRRWQQLLGDNPATRGNTDGRREDVADRLRGLGLSPENAELNQNRRPDDVRGGVSDDGIRSQPPQDFLERYRAFLRKGG